MPKKGGSLSNLPYVPYVPYVYAAGTVGTNTNLIQFNYPTGFPPTGSVLPAYVQLRRIHLIHPDLWHFGYLRTRCGIWLPPGSGHGFLNEIDPDLIQEICKTCNRKKF